MSPNHLRFDQAIQELRDVRPGTDQRERSLDAVLIPRRMTLKQPSLAAAALVVVALLLFLIPTRGSGLAWADVLRRTQQATDLHITSLSHNGHVVGEQWRSGNMWALWIKDQSGRILCETRSDRSHFYTFLYRKELTSPNATQYGTLWNKTPQMLEGERRFRGPSQTVDRLLSSGRAKLIRQENAEFGGAAVQRYVLNVYGQVQTVEADSKTGRILLVRTKGGETERFEYPESLDPKIFSFEARITHDVPVLDLRGKEDPKKLPPYMPKPIVSKGGIQLREVSLGEAGDLFVFWTGYLPNKRAAKRLRAVGVKEGSTRWLGYYSDGVHQTQSPSTKRLICWRVTLREKIGDCVTIRIPTAFSSVVFKSMPVKRLLPLGD